MEDKGNLLEDEIFQDTEGVGGVGTLEHFGLRSLSQLLATFPAS
jgi:hypothetical protein